MDKTAIESKIEDLFRRQAKSDKTIHNAYLLVHSDRSDIHLNISEGVNTHPAQPCHMASVGKLFTACIIAILHEKGDLSFEDRISRYLDSDIMKGLNVYKGTDYSDEIRISHLLNQSSGLNDVFYCLLKKMVKNELMITPREAVIWGKENLKTKGKPGERHFYTDTNYYLLGLLVENITKKPFHESLHELIFEPLGMNNAFMQGYSKPAVKSGYPPAKLYLQGIDTESIAGLFQIDYAGGGVVAPLEEFLIFMKALVNHKLIKKKTLERMLEDEFPMGFPALGFNYGYAVWKVNSIPLLLPGKFKCWGCVGVTGAFMFYHPRTDSYIIGTFNDSSYRSKALRFMLSKVIKTLLKTAG